ncbi:50S ribosomal protein L33 [Allofustis seminis]|uniref:50S ribosomal protein L33 n=1 Tax=Allofustis seminis TaxID=166939 RepID=UPI0009FD0E6C|nr:50S ribosomal protein L33 [Allofustis seminis]
MKKRKTSLACSECGCRNYSLEPRAKIQTERLEIKKFCKRCGKHTLHKETR